MPSPGTLPLTPQLFCPVRVSTRTNVEHSASSALSAPIDVTSSTDAPPPSSIRPGHATGELQIARVVVEGLSGSTQATSIIASTAIGSSAIFIFIISSLLLGAQFGAPVAALSTRRHRDVDSPGHAHRQIAIRPPAGDRRSREVHAGGEPPADQPANCDERRGADGKRDCGPAERCELVAIHDDSSAIASSSAAFNSAAR